MEQNVDMNKDYNQLDNCASCAVGMQSDFRNWYVAMVKNNTEISSSKILCNLGYEVFLPVQEVISIWKDGRKKKCQRILLPGLILICLTEKQRKEVASLSFINKFLVNRAGIVNSYNCHPIAIVPNEQVQRLKFLLGDESSIVNIEPLNLRTGDKVRVIRGNLRGLEGNVYQKPNGKSYIVIKLNNLCCASVSVPLKDIEAI